jgi:hypothetical protein
MHPATRRIGIRVLIALAAVLAVLLPGVAATIPTPAAADPGPVLISSVDLHDGQVTKTGPASYVMVGTEYGCGYQWYIANTPWCGFGYSTAPTPTGPWSTPQLLFDPNSNDPWTGQSWQVECGSTGQGCFNARLIQRTGWGSNDGVWLLWFSSPLDWSRNHANAYNNMGCDFNGVAFGCGPGETVGTHGSYTKPSMWFCTGNGDLGVITPPTGFPAIACTQPGSASLSIEQLNWWGVGGSQTAGANNLAGLTSIEAPGGYYDTATSTYVLTYSDPDCGYCAGTATGYATASSLLGPYTAPVNVAAAAPVATARRDLSAGTCGGQPRTVSVLDGQAYQGVDLWTGSRNETSADTLLLPLTYTGAPSQTPGDGQPWTPPFTPWNC